MTDSDDDVPSLPADTLAVLQQFNEERWLIANRIDFVDEDWQLSQFWYSAETARKLCSELIYIAGLTGRIACVSCPTLVQYLLEIDENRLYDDRVTLFEYDNRFATRFPSHYVPYDYRLPLSIPHYFKAVFDVIIADPPFLSTECLEKTAQTVRLLGKPDAKIILCSGAVMEDVVGRLLGLHRLKFEPSHVNGLSNQFACFANYETKYLDFEAVHPQQ